MLVPPCLHPPVRPKDLSAWYMEVGMTGENHEIKRRCQLAREWVVLGTRRCRVYTEPHYDVDHARKEVVLSTAEYTAY